MLPPRLHQTNPFAHGIEAIDATEIDVDTFELTANIAAPTL
jgi:hypothetical protein